jgi:hypothetical protein
MTRKEKTVYRERAFYRNAMTGKMIDDEILLVRNIKKHFRTVERLKPLIPYVRGGVRLFNYLFDGQKAAEVGLPKGFALKPIEVETSSKRGMQEMHVVEWINSLLLEQFSSSNPSNYLPEDTCPRCLFPAN